MAHPKATGGLPYSVQCDTDWCLRVKLPTSPECLFRADRDDSLPRSAHCIRVPSVTGNHRNTNNLAYICWLLCVGTRPSPAYRKVTGRREPRDTPRAVGSTSSSQSANTSLPLKPFSYNLPCCFPSLSSSQILPTH